MWPGTGRSVPLGKLKELCHLYPAQDKLTCGVALPTSTKLMQGIFLRHPRDPFSLKVLPPLLALSLLHLDVYAPPHLHIRLYTSDKT